MKLNYCYLGIIFCLILSGCGRNVVIGKKNKSNDVKSENIGFLSKDNPDPLEKWRIVETDILDWPACTNSYPDVELVIRNEKELRQKQAAHGITGNLFTFTGDGSTNRLKYPLPIIDSDGDGKITSMEVRFSVSKGPFKINSGGKNVAFPYGPMHFHEKGKGFIFFKDQSPYTEDFTVPESDIFTYDIKTGEIIFATAPNRGVVLEVSGWVLEKSQNNQICDEYKHDFRSTFLVGYEVSGNGCTLKPNHAAFISNENKKLVFCIQDNHTKDNSCTEQLVTFRNLLLVDQIPPGYDIELKHGKIIDNGCMTP